MTSDEYNRIEAYVEKCGKAISERIEEFKARHNMCDHDFVIRAGISLQDLHRITVKGYIRLRDLQKIANAVGCKPYELLIDADG